MGDQLLAEVGGRLRRGLREVDVASRFGGDEFALLLHEVDRAGAEAAADRVLEALREPVDLAGRAVSVTASVGLAVGSARYADGDEVLRDADIAMYGAKASQRGTDRFFDTDGGARGLRSLHLGNRAAMTDADPTEGDAAAAPDPVDEDTDEPSVLDRMRGAGVGVEDPTIVGDPEPGLRDAEIAEDEPPQV